MTAGRTVRACTALAVCSLLFGQAATGTPAVAGTGTPTIAAVRYAQTQCTPPGDALTPVPWAQRLLAPERAWRLATGAGQRVAVVSTGVSANPFLSGAVAARIDLSPAPEFGEPSGERDCLGIGTGVAGVIAAAPTAGVGFHGLAPDARILDLKVVGDQFPSGAPPNVVSAGLLAEAVGQAVDRDATVIVLAVMTLADSDALREAVEAAIDAGIVVVAAVGEPASEEEPPDLVPYPAGYDGVIGVGALAPEGTAAGSRTGQVDLVAPGVGLVTTYPGDGLGEAAGSGFAAGYVAASVALVRQYRPELSPAQVSHRLFATAAPTPGGIGSPEYGYGIVNPYQAMVDQLVDEEPVDLPPYVPVELGEEERQRLAAEERGEALALRLAAIGLGAAVVLGAAAGFGARAGRRRWRAGLAPAPPDRPEDDAPEPPMELFGGRPPAQGG